MIKLGEWLETYLNPDIKAREYRKLAEDFIRLYDVDFELTKNDITLQLFQFLDDQSPETKKGLIDTLSNLDSFRIGKLSLEETPKIDPAPLGRALHSNLSSKPEGKILDFINSKIDYGKSNTLERRFFFWIEYSYLNFARAIYIKAIAINTFTEITTKEGLWGNVFEDYQEWKVGSSLLIREYNHLVEKLMVSNKTTVKKIKTFTTDRGHNFSDIAQQNDTGSCFPWSVVLARVFFDFLFLGGQDRICFCKQCARFCVAKRKKRKEYCSNLCRTHASNARIAQMGA